MNSDLSFRRIFYFGFLILVLALGLFFKSVLSSETTLVFCNVGQGDASYVRIGNKTDILIDGGPGGRVLECLGKYMPIFDRTIELAIASHPEKDHIGGYLSIVKRYRIKLFLIPDSKHETVVFSKLKQMLKEEKVKVLHPNSDNDVLIKNARIDFLWPPAGFSGELQRGPNDSSLIFKLDLGGRKILYTGDAPAYVLTQLSGLSQRSKLETDILKIPHHGSKNGLERVFFTLANPSVSVISVGKQNSYGHPSKEVLDILRASKTKILRTDEIGDVVFRF